MDLDHQIRRVGAYWSFTKKITCATCSGFQGAKYGRSLDEAAVVRLIAHSDSGTLDSIGDAGQRIQSR